MCCVRVCFRACMHARDQSCGSNAQCRSGTKGQLGNGNSSPDAVPGEGYNSSKPLPVAGGHTFAAIETSSWHTCALETTGKAWCWGKREMSLGMGILQDLSIMAC